MSDEADKAEMLAALEAQGFDASVAEWSPARDRRAYSEVVLYECAPGFTVCLRAHVDERGNPPGRFCAPVRMFGEWTVTSRHPTAAAALDAGMRRARRKVLAARRVADSIAKFIKKPRKDGAKT